MGGAKRGPTEPPRGELRLALFFEPAGPLRAGRNGRPSRRSEAEALPIEAFSRIEGKHCWTNRAAPCCRSRSAVRWSPNPGTAGWFPAAARWQRRLGTTGAYTSARRRISPKPSAKSTRGRRRARHWRPPFHARPCPARCRTFERHW